MRHPDEIGAESHRRVKVAGVVPNTNSMLRGLLTSVVLDQHDARACEDGGGRTPEVHPAINFAVAWASPGLTGTFVRPSTGDSRG